MELTQLAQQSLPTVKEAEGYSSVVALAEEHFEEGLGKPARLSFSCSWDLLLNERREW